MALWGDNDAVTVTGTVSLDYETKIVTGSGTNFGEDGGPKEGDVIRFGTSVGGADYIGDADIAVIYNSESLLLAHTCGLSGAAIAGSAYQVSELPLSSVLDVTYSESESGTATKNVYGIGVSEVGAAATTAFEVPHAGWVGVLTYIDSSGELRVKSEVLVAGSHVVTGNDPVYPNI